MLPRHSLYKAALDDCEDLAEIASALGGDEDERPAVPLARYDEVVLRLDNVFDALNAINETLIAVHSAKKPVHRPNRAPRPETAYQRLKTRRKVEQLDAIVQRMTPGR